MTDHTYYLIMSQVFLAASLCGESNGGSFFCFIVSLVYAGCAIHTGGSQ